MSAEAPTRVLLVTGPSGAGRTTALSALEDLGFEAIDNLPLSLLPRLLDGRPLDRPLALGIDARNRDFSVTGGLDALAAMAEHAAYAPLLLYLDCRPEVLLRRFSETRRRHPVAQDDAPSVGVAREMILLRPLRDQADLIIDTSEYTLHDLRAALGRHFGAAEGPGLTVTIQSFSYKRGLPQDLDCALDVRFLSNPHWVPELRGRTGTDPAVQAHVAADPAYAAFFAQARTLFETLLPAYIAEGKSHLGIGFGCTGGRHRSVAVAEKMAAALADAGWRVSIRHRDMERPGAEDGAGSGEGKPG